MRLLSLLILVASICGFAGPAQAASDDVLQKYAEAVDLLDRWRGDRTTLDAAHDRITELLLEAPDFAPAHVELARWYLMNSHNNESALRALERAQKLEPGFAGIYVLRGYIFQKQGRLHEALAELDQAETIGTDNPWLALNRGFTLDKLGRSDEALVLFHAVFEQHLDDPKAWPTAKAELLTQFARRGDSEAMEQLHLQAIKLRPQDPAQAEQYASWLLENARFDDALALLRSREQTLSGESAQALTFAALSGRAAHLVTSGATRPEAEAAFDDMVAYARSLGAAEAPTYDVWVEQVREHAAANN